MQPQSSSEGLRTLRSNGSLSSFPRSGSSWRPQKSMTAIMCNNLFRSSAAAFFPMGRDLREDIILLLRHDRKEIFSKFNRPKVVLSCNMALREFLKIFQFPEWNSHKRQKILESLCSDFRSEKHAIFAKTSTMNFSVRQPFIVIKPTALERPVLLPYEKSWKLIIVIRGPAILQTIILLLICNLSMISAYKKACHLGLLC